MAQNINIFILHTIFKANYGLEIFLSVMSAILHYKLPLEVIEGSRDWVIMLIISFFSLGQVFDHGPDKAKELFQLLFYPPH